MSSAHAGVAHSVGGHPQPEILPRTAAGLASRIAGDAPRSRSAFAQIEFRRKTCTASTLLRFTINANLRVLAGAREGCGGWRAGA
eukprot:6535496-Prymnesium_polylepis.1